jgi:hypothetical protein
VSGIVSAARAILVLLVGAGAGVLLRRFFMTGRQLVMTTKPGRQVPTSGPSLPSADHLPRGPVPAAIFLCYRREDSSGYTGRIFDHLARHFDPGQVFMDIDSIDPGVDFTEVVDRAVARSAAIVAVIGRSWLSAADERGGRRLDDPTDYVRRELSIALFRDARVIPVLVQGAQMPTVEQLPEPLQPLAHRNALELSDTRWTFDIAVLTRALDRAVAEVHGRAGAGVHTVPVEAPGQLRPTRRPAPEFVAAAPPVARSGGFPYLILFLAVFAMLAGIVAWRWLSDLSHAVGVPAPVATLVVSSHSYPVRSMSVCSDGVLPGLVVEVILDGQTAEVPIVTWDGVTTKGKTIYPGTPLLLKVSNGLNCPRS